MVSAVVLTKRRGGEFGLGGEGRGGGWFVWMVCPGERRSV